jgi:DNA-binding MarR family transcriptional regulator
MKGPIASDRDRAWQGLVAVVMDGRWDWRRKMSEAAGLPFSRVRALDRLRRGPLTMRALAEVTGTDPPATTVIVNDLEARGLVVRETHPDDKRAKVVTLTAEGRRVMQSARAVNEKAPPTFDDLSDKDAADLIRIAERLGGPGKRR